MAASVLAILHLLWLRDGQLPPEPLFLSDTQHCFSELSHLDSCAIHVALHPSAETATTEQHYSAAQGSNLQELHWQFLGVPCRLDTVVNDQRLVHLAHGPRPRRPRWLAQSLKITLRRPKARPQDVCWKALRRTRTLQGHRWQNRQGLLLLSQCIPRLLHLGEFQEEVWDEAVLLPCMEQVLLGRHAPPGARG